MHIGLILDRNCIGNLLQNLDGILLPGSYSDVNCIKHEQGIPLARKSHNLEVAGKRILPRLITSKILS